jgi:hypothetical protein
MNDATGDDARAQPADPTKPTAPRKPGGAGASPPTMPSAPVMAWESAPGRVGGSSAPPPLPPVPPTIASPVAPPMSYPVGPGVYGPTTASPQRYPTAPAYPAAPSYPGSPYGAGATYPTGPVSTPVAAPASPVDSGGAAGSAVALGAEGGKAAVKAAGFVARHFRRAFIRDMQAAVATPDEEEKLTARRVTATAVRRFLAWRRSWLIVLLPVAGVSAIIHIARLFDEEKWEIYTAFGTLVFVCYHLLTQLAFPLAAAVAIWTWDRSRLSRWLLVGGFVASFLLPMLFFLFPFHWWVKWESDAADVAAIQRAQAGALGAATYFLLLMPTVTSLIPGVLRACTRIKSLLPESIVPGWFLVFSAPLYALVLYLLFIVVNQVAGNPLLLMGMFMLMAAPAVYLTRLPILIRPMTTESDRRQLDRLQLAYAIMMGAALVLLLLYVNTARVGDRPLVGTPPEALLDSGDVLWEVIKFLFTYLSKSMFITAVAVDLFMLVNLSVWRNTRAFGGTPESDAYDQQMLAFGEVADGTPAKPLPLGFTRELMLGVDVKPPPFQ